MTQHSHPECESQKTTLKSQLFYDGTTLEPDLIPRTQSKCQSLDQNLSFQFCESLEKKEL